LFFLRFNTFTYVSFNWIHDMFYQYDIHSNRYVKRIIPNFGEYLTPLALAIWFQDDGSKIENTVRIATNSFNYKDNLLLCKILKDKYNLDCSVIESGQGENKVYIIYIYKNSYPLFKEIITEYVLPSMCYKLP
jgi:hypothetical protein